MSTNKYRCFIGLAAVAAVFAGTNAEADYDFEPTRGLVRGGNEFAIALENAVVNSIAIDGVLLSNFSERYVSSDDPFSQDFTSYSSGIIPAHVAGIAAVVATLYSGVQLPLGTYTYIALPEITTVTPNMHSTKTDRRSFTVNGYGFDNQPTVLFGGRAASGIVVNGFGTIIHLVPPAIPAGSPVPFVVNVELVNPDGKSASIEKCFYLSSDNSYWRDQRIL